MKTPKNPARITLDSRVADLYANPVGHDALAKVLMQLNLSDSLLTNPLVAGMKLKRLAALTYKQLGPDFWMALLKLVNNEPDKPLPLAVADAVPVQPAWWKEAVFYQIYPRSFRDSDGDGVGDLRGILEKLDYLADLGVTALWLSPIYDSPNDDNGYDIRDYKKIMAEFGTMEDFDALLAGAHARGIRLIMDLVVNHTSDEHEWFQKALADENSPYRDYYFFRKGKPADGYDILAAAAAPADPTRVRNGQVEPNNWTSFFSGPAWNYYPQQDVWALHLFSKKQMDLNWENPALRAEVVEMVNWWLDKGVDGFRMDVINYISKEPGLPDGDPAIGKLMGFPGIEKYYYGPRMHEYFRQLHDQAFAPHGAFSVGECPGLGRDMSRLVTGAERGELDMVFNFDHLETPGHVRMDDYEYDLNFYRDHILEWIGQYGNNCWTALFYNNHDNPRMVSKVCKEPAWHTPLAILLAAMQMTLKGTPFVFQGDEMGLANYEFTGMEQITDVEAKGYYAEHAPADGHDKTFAAILAGTREHARVLLPWNSTLLPEHQTVPQQTGKKTVYAAYKQLIALRRAEPALVYGDLEALDTRKDRFVYTRSLDGVTFLIDCNLGRAEQTAHEIEAGYELAFPAALENPATLRPYEVRIWKRTV